MAAGNTAALEHNAVAAALARLESQDALARLQARDPSLWTGDRTVAERISQRLGWLDTRPHEDQWRVQLQGLAETARRDGLARIVLAGMGGSSLAPEVLWSIFGDRSHLEDFTVLDSTHPDAVRRTLVDADLSGTLVVVASKSGGTIETASFAAIAAERVPSPAHLLAITDPGSALDQQAQAEGWRAVLHNPADIGGRFSALSLFGMAPAALMGAPLDALWQGASALRGQHAAATPAAEAPAAQLAAFIAGHARDGRDKMTLVAPPEISALGDWIEQLVAESTGKDGSGIVPVVGEPLGVPDAYGQDRVFVAYRLHGQSPAGTDALADAGLPVFFIDLADATQLGAEFLRWELATALAGALLDVNPFDEPDVTAAKEQTAAVLHALTTGDALPPVEDGDILAMVQQLRPGDYLAIHAYLCPDAPTLALFDQARAALRDHLRLTATFGWGPRFLHSTGQLHKGGGDNVAVLQVVDRRLWQHPSPAGAPIDVPGQSYDIGTLLCAQAVGDLRALRAQGRSVTQIGVANQQHVAALVEVITNAARHDRGR